MNKDSLVVHISIFFAFLLVIINTLFFFQYQLEEKKSRDDIEKLFFETREILNKPPLHKREKPHRQRREAPPQHRLPNRDMPRGEIPNEIQQRVYNILGIKVLHQDKIVSTIESKKQIDKIKELIIYQDSNHTYIVHNNTLAIYYKNKDSNRVSYLVIIFTINSLLILFYLYIFNKLKPLQKLKYRIIDFANGNLEVYSIKDGKDEISQVSNEFNNAIIKIKSLQDSRNLFLRNIMHELKTPITKGKLITDIINDSKNQTRLKNIFFRFEYLLGEFSKIEQITSNSIILNKKKFRVVDILDNSFDILLITSSDVDIEINANLEIEADYQLFSIALKNLIDNAIKYGEEEAKIIINKDNIIIESYGDKLKNISFKKAFNRAFENSSKGLGLGLYITHHIVEKHKFELKYSRVDRVNKFTIHI